MRTGRLKCLVLVTLGYLIPTVVLSQEVPLIAVAPPSADALSAAPRAAVTAGHVLGANDLIEIKVFQEPELNTVVRVSNDGKILFPLIGEVTVSDKTIAQAGQLIRDRLEARFLVNPEVSVALVEAARRLFTVLGQVQRPGTYRFPDGQSLDLVQVIGIAGGYTRTADSSRVTVKRRVGDDEQVLHVNAKRMAADHETKAFHIKPGDLITIAERFF